MMIYTEKLKYAGTTNVTEYDCGLKTYDNVYQIYESTSIRDKVVCRADLLYLLKDFFMDETLDKYRDVIFMLCTRQVQDVQTISDCLIQLVDMDSVFEEKLTQIYSTMDKETTTYGDAILNSIAGILVGKEAYFRSFFRHKKEFVICVSDGWLYFSVQDENKEVELPKDLKVEVLSYAKNWTGKFKWV